MIKILIRARFCDVVMKMLIDDENVKLGGGCCCYVLIGN
jgi:hypothetical protein